MRTTWALVTPSSLALLLVCAARGIAAPLPSDLLDASYVHMKYAFDLDLIYMKRSGAGEMWVVFDDHGARHIKYQGRAVSPAFGEGDVVVLVDVAESFLYAYFKLPDMEEKQCIRYHFPTEAERKVREPVLHWRESQVEMASHAGEASPFEVKWTYDRKHLHLEVKDGQLQTIKLLHNNVTRKTVHVEQLEVSRNVPNDTDVFAKPNRECPWESDVHNPIAELELVPPHRKSSSLNDLLVALKDAQTFDHAFILLSAFAVPGDVAVMIEQPEPPQPFDFGGVTYNYTATAHIPGAPDHESNGSIWMDLDNRQFRLRGEATQTQGRGPFYLNLIAQGGEKDPRVFAYVNLPQEEQQQCINYDYPELKGEDADRLKAGTSTKLTFSKVDEIHGEDCAIFKTQLPRGRTLLLWMDLESDRPEAILRSEVWKGSTMLRRTDIHSWRTLKNADMELQPRDPWNCAAHAQSQVAFFNLHDVHKNSLELWDVLYSLKHFRSNFTVLEVLALTGDVAVLIEEPQFPDLELLSDLSFNYIATLKGLDNGSQPVVLHGSFLSSKEKELVFAHSTVAGGTNISIAMELGELEGTLSAKLTADARSELLERPSCFSMPLGGGWGSAALSAEQWQFMGMDIIGDTECNRFQSPSNRVGEVKTASVELWYSPVDQKVLRLEVVSPETHDATLVTLEIDHWEGGLAVDAIEKNAEDQSRLVANHWHCVDASEYRDAWLQLSTEQSLPTNKVVAADVLSKLGEALGRTSLLPLMPSAALSKFEIISTGDATAPHHEQSPGHDRPSLNERTVLDPEVAAMSFEFTSTKRAGTGSHVAEQKGDGQLHVDFVNMRLSLTASAEHVSPGLPFVKSHIILEGGPGHLYIVTSVSAGMGKPVTYEQCVSVQTGDAFQADPNGRPRNPFADAQQTESDSRSYFFDLDRSRRVVLRTTHEGRDLVGIEVKDRERDTWTNIQVRAFEVADKPTASDYNLPAVCKDPISVEVPTELGAWELLRIFFPPGLGEKEESRRLHVV